MELAPVSSEISDLCGISDSVFLSVILPLRVKESSLAIAF